MNKACNQSTAKVGQICNPITGKWIKIGGPTYQTLVSQGLLNDTSKSAQKSVSKATSQLKTDKTTSKGQRKAPETSATQVPVGTEMYGTDGKYIVRLRKNGSQYWAKCANKGSNCQSSNQQGGNLLLSALPTLSELAIPAGLTAASHFAHNYYTGEAPTEKEQTGGNCRARPQTKSRKGGNPLLATAADMAVPALLTASAHYLPSENDNNQSGGNPLLLAASDLMIPVGLTAGAHWLASLRQNETNEQSGGNPLLMAIADLSVPVGLTMGAHYLSRDDGEKILQAGGAEAIPIIDDPIMNSYLGMKGIGLLTPQTLIPLGILIAVYLAYKNRYDQGNFETTQFNPDEEQQQGGVHKEISEMVDFEDLQKYLNLKGITTITPQTEFPFAAVMGPDVFKKYVEELEQMINKTNKRSQQKKIRK